MMIRRLGVLSDTIHECDRISEIPELIQLGQHVPPARPAGKRLQLTLNRDI